MAVTCIPYDSGTYTQEQFAEMVASFLRDGYVDGYNDELEVVQSTTPAMTCSVSSGRACIQGYWYENPEDQTAAFSAADATNPRIDRVVLRLETGAPRQISIKVLKGTAAGSPTAPALTQNSTTWEISLARVAIAAGQTTITTSNITDERDDVSVCGKTSSGPLKFSGITINANLDLGTHKIVDVADGTDPTDAVSKLQFDTLKGAGEYGMHKCDIMAWPGSSVPSGWLECNGQSVSSVTYPKLYASIGTTFGGDGSPNFCLPDLSGNFPMGATSSLGTKAGVKTVTLDITMIPAHTHPLPGSAKYGTPGSSDLSTGDTITTDTSGSYGLGGAHDNLHPYMVLRYIVRAS